jgi:hypothetical protein
MAAGPHCCTRPMGDANWRQSAHNQLRGSGEHVCEKLRERWYRGQTCPEAWQSAPARERLAPAMHLLSDSAAKNPLAA